MTKANSKRLAILHIVLMFFLAASPFLMARPVQAANFTEASLRLDRMKAELTDVQMLVVVKPATVGTEVDVKVDYPTGFTVDTTASNVTVTTAGIPSTYQGEALTAAPGMTGVASSVTGGVGGDATFTVTDLSVGTLYGFFITAGIDNPQSAAEYQVILTAEASGPTTIDSSTVAVRIITDDQITVTATVPPTFNFTIDNNSVTFDSDLSSSSVVSSTGSNDASVTIATNAANGWIAWLQSANTSLDSAPTSEVIETGGTVDDACTTLTTGNDFYQLDVDLTTDSGTGDGTVTIDDEYDCGATTGGTYSTTLEEIATANGTTNGDVITLVARATITAVKSAADDYTDTWTVVGAGNF